MESVRTRTDLNDFYDNVEYKNGYPISDYISCDIDTDIRYSIKERLLPSERFVGVVIKYENGIAESYSGGNIETPGFDRIYWQTYWLIEDGIENHKIKKLDVKGDVFLEKEILDKSVSAYKVTLKSQYKEDSNWRNVFIDIIITENNNIYIIQQCRTDLFSWENDTLYVFEYIGELPDALSYGIISNFHTENIT